MQRAHQLEPFRLLSWQSIRQGNFTTFELNDLTGGQPLLFIGWAILCSLCAQQALTKEPGLDCVLEELSVGCRFQDEFKKHYVTICGPLSLTTTVTSRTTMQLMPLMFYNHCIFWFRDSQKKNGFMQCCLLLDIFSILLSAAVNDVKVQDRPMLIENWVCYYVQCQVCFRELARCSCFRQDAGRWSERDPTDSLRKQGFSRQDARKKKSFSMPLGNSSIPSANEWLMLFFNQIWRSIWNWEILLARGMVLSRI